MASGTLNTAKKLLKLYTTKGFDKILAKAEIVAASEGSVTATMKIEEDHTNGGGMLHGGMSALIVDDITGIALMMNPNTPPGVSVNINMSYLRPAPLGSELVIKAWTEKLGSNLAFLVAEIIDKQSGKIVAKGSHTKYLSGTPPLRSN